MTPRKHRLATLAFIRLLWDDLKENEKHAISVLEKYIDGMASQNTLKNAIHKVAPDRHRRITSAIRSIMYRDFTSSKIVPFYVKLASDHLPFKVTEQHINAIEDEILTEYKEHLILTSDVKNIAQGIYKKKDYQSLPILADALEETGCQDAKILKHLRNGSHIHGCWALDAAMGNPILAPEDDW